MMFSLIHGSILKELIAVLLWNPLDLIEVVLLGVFKALFLRQIYFLRVIIIWVEYF